MQKKFKEEENTEIFSMFYNFNYYYPDFVICFKNTKVTKDSSPSQVTAA